jgi:hypothetical protein
MILPRDASDDDLSHAKHAQPDGSAPGEASADGGGDIVEDGESRKRASGLAGWPISAAVHLVVALIFGYVVFATHKEEEELAPMRVTSLDLPPKNDEKKDQRELEAKLEVNVETLADVAAPATTPDVKLEEVSQSEEDNDAQVAKGREEAVSASETGGQGAFMAIGAGGGSAGMFGSRSGGGKHRALAKGGGTHASESAVDGALRWFKKHQSPNGMWDPVMYPANCQETPKCEPGDIHNAFGSNPTVAMTGYAVLCFLGAGFDHKTPSKFKATVQKGLQYLLKAQRADGLMGVRNYEHAVGTMALAEAFAMTGDPDLKAPAQNSVKFLLERQIKDTGKNADKKYNALGWDYELPNPGRVDASVTGWCVMALKSALAGGLNVGTGMEGAKKWLERSWKAANPDWAKLADPYMAESGFPYVWDPNTEAVEIGAPGGAAHDMAPIGALCAVFLGHHGGDIMLESLCNHIMKYQVPTAYPCNTYYMYYSTLAIFQAGGDRWKRWNSTVRDLLVKAQRQSADCFDGSWDAHNTVFTGSEMGRVLSTAYCCLCLEVYYRYKQVGAADAGKETPKK